MPAPRQRALERLHIMLRVRAVIKEAGPVVLESLVVSRFVAGVELNHEMWWSSCGQST